jgi:TDG/mug DNA glycosylase family protein
MQDDLGVGMRLELRGMDSGKNGGRLTELPDYLATGLKVIFVGFNPSIYSARVGHYYARPANQFWSCLNESGLLPAAVRLGPQDDSRLPLYGLGLTDVVKPPTRSCSELTASDYESGVSKLREKLNRYTPKIVALNGKGIFEAYRRFGQPDNARVEPVQLGLRDRDSAGVQVFVLPSTSSINARLSLEQKAAWFKQLGEWVNRYA